MRYGDVNHQPANSQAAEPEGGLYRTILESSDQGFCTIEVAFDENERPLDYRFLEVSSSFERQTGIKDAAGRWMREIASDQDQFWFDIYGRVARSGEPERFENFSTPLNRWWSVYAFKIEGSARIAVLFDDITTRKRAEAALRASEEQFETLLHQAPLGVYLVDSDFVIREVNPVALPVFGDIPGGPIGRDFDEVIHALWDKEYADEIVGIFRGTLATGEAYVTPERAEYRVDRDITEYYEWRLDRILLSGGQYGVVCYFRDISANVNARKEIEEAREAARQGEERQAFLLKMSDAIRLLGDPLEIQSAALRVLGEHLAVNRVFFNDVDEERDEYVINRTYTNGVAPLTGHFRLSEIRWTAECAGSGQIIILDDAGTDPRLSEAERASYAAMETASGIGVPLIKDGRWVAGLGVHQNTPRQWTPEEIDLVRETAERTWAAVERARAEGALRESERHKGLLLAELQHRVRNTLTMVRSVARRTGENCEDVDDYVRHLDGRLASLARVQTILTREPGRGVDLHALVLDELMSQAALPALYRIEGVKVELSPKAAEVLSLAVHELATNSTKYGVLSESSGTIRIRWAVDDRDGQPWLRFTWHEPVSENSERPARTGFGTDLIVNRVPYELRGNGHLLIENKWVEASVDFPLAIETKKREITEIKR